jgi:hypothetical protein
MYPIHQVIKSKDIHLNENSRRILFRMESGQSSWLQIQRSWVRYPALPDFLRSSVSGMGFTQPRDDN